MGSCYGRQINHSQIISVISKKNNNKTQEKESNNTKKENKEKNDSQTTSNPNKKQLPLKELNETPVFKTTITTKPILEQLLKNQRQ